jgi:hypothetical protein
LGLRFGSGGSRFNLEPCIRGPSLERSKFGIKPDPGHSEVDLRPILTDKKQHTKITSKEKYRFVVKKDFHTRT